MADAKALLFIDYHQTQIGELDVFRKQAVSADQDVNLAGLDALHNASLFFGGAKATNHLDLDGKCCEAPLECFKVLEGQYGSRRKHRDLLVIAHRLERG